MQAQSRLAASGGGGGGSGGDISFVAAPVVPEEHDAVVRELTRGHELTAQLQAALQEQGRAEATATFILGEVSRAFTICLKFMGSAPSASAATRAPLSSSSPRPETPDSGVSVGAAPAPAPPPRSGREDNVPRKTILTPYPLDDGYQWRKYGQKRINNTHFPRSYYRCTYHRERKCPAQKHMQRHSGDDVPLLYVVVYTHEHTCQEAPAELQDATNSTGGAPPSDYFPWETSSLRHRGAQVGRSPQLVDERAAMEERERQVLVSSLACVLQGREGYVGDPDESRGASVGVGVGVGAVHAPAAAPVAASSELPGPDDAGEGLDVMDYDVTDALFWGPLGADSNSCGTTAPDIDTLF